MSTTVQNIDLGSLLKFKSMEDVYNYSVIQLAQSSTSTSSLATNYYYTNYIALFFLILGLFPVICYTLFATVPIRIVLSPAEVLVYFVTIIYLVYKGSAYYTQYYSYIWGIVQIWLIANLVQLIGFNMTLFSEIVLLPIAALMPVFFGLSIISGIAYYILISK